MNAQFKIRTAARMLKKGEVVAFPTETVYGLGANALDANAVAKVFLLKGRPADNPLIVHIGDDRMLATVAGSISPIAKRLMKRFWPGPLTIIFRKKSAVPSITTGGRADVAVRMPKHPVALRLIKEAGVPIAAPSANRSGRPSPTAAAHVLEDFPNLFVIDGGETQHGVESTVISLVGKPAILRLGAISVEEIREIIPAVAVKTRPVGNVAASPGQKYKHYAPSIPLYLFRNADTLKEHVKKDSVILCREQDLKRFTNAVSLGKTNEEIAHNIYAALRTYKNGELLILGVPNKGLGRTVMDRLEKAATAVF